MKADLVDLSRKWAEISGDIDGCPVSFTDEEARECFRLKSAQDEADEQLRECQDIIGVGSEGWISMASYEKAKAREKKFKRETFEAAETEEERRRLEENWIFDDFSEEDYT